jgi:hypothetical protein
MWQHILYLRMRRFSAGSGLAGQAHDSLERHHNDQAKTFDECFPRKQILEQCGNHSLRSLYNAQLLVHLSNTPVVQACL